MDYLENMNTNEKWKLTKKNLIDIYTRVLHSPHFLF
jgi:hypothetical protein